jgi:hypothetical protein
MRLNGARTGNGDLVRGATRLPLPDRAFWDDHAVTR